MKSALYIRVSTQEQVAGYSLDAQEQKLKEYAEYQKFDIVGVYRDEGFSASTMQRPALIQMIDDVQAGKVNIVIVYKLDRLSRRVKDVLELVELFEKYSVSLFSLTENLDVSSPFGRAALKMSATFSELERETITERMALGKAQRVKQGKMMGMGIKTAPFGYRLVKDEKRFEIVPEEAEMIKKIFQLYIDGYSSRKLHHYAAETFQHPYFSSPTAIMKIINRPMYGGFFNWKGELHKGVNFEPIIDFAVYLKAQKIKEQNTSRRTRENTPYLLTGLALCAHCGNRYVGKLYDRNTTRKNGNKTTKYIYTAYGCAARVKRDKKYHPAICGNKIFPAQDLDDHVGECVKAFMFSDYQDGEYTSGLIDDLVSENSRLQERIGKMLDLYLEESINKETYQQRTADIEKQITKNKTVIEAETLKIQSMPTASVDYLLEMQADYDNLNKKDRRRLLHELIKYIIIDGDNVSIQWRVK